jgi:hypothetical protein
MAVFRPNAALLAAAQARADASAAGTASGYAFATPGALGISATAYVEVSRLCGSEACLGAAAVHTQDMPCSLAWVSSTQRLCFGSIAAEHKLRWRSCGLQGTPLAVAVHARTDTIVLLLAADEFAAVEEPPLGSSSSMPQQHQQQQLQYACQRLAVLDAKSLRVLLSLALAPGHTYTTLQVLELPATSQQQRQQTAQRSLLEGVRAGGGAAAAGADSQHAASQQHRQQQQQAGDCSPGCLPFIVLGSHAVIAAAHGGPSTSRNAAARHTAAPRVQRLGMLSIFELRKSVVQAVPNPKQQSAGSGGSGSELHYELVLHGIVPLQVAPASACTVVPELLAQSLQQTRAEPTGAHVSVAAATTAMAGESAQRGGSEGTQPAAGRGAAAVAAEPPLLVVGSERGLTLLRVMVDDAALAEQQALQRLLQEVGTVGACALTQALTQSALMTG